MNPAIKPLPPSTIPRVVEYYVEDILVLRKEFGIPTYSYDPRLSFIPSGVEIFWDNELVFQVRDGRCTLDRLSAIAKCRRSLV